MIFIYGKQKLLCTTQKFIPNTNNDRNQVLINLLPFLILSNFNDVLSSTVQCFPFLQSTHREAWIYFLLKSSSHRKRKCLINVFQMNQEVNHVTSFIFNWLAWVMDSIFNTKQPAKWKSTWNINWKYIRIF